MSLSGSSVHREIEDARKHGFTSGRAFAFKEIAALVRAVGCRKDLCAPDGSVHAPNCPIALARRIQELGE